MALPPVPVPVAVPVLRLPVHRDLDGAPKLAKVLVLPQRLLQVAQGGASVGADGCAGCHGMATAAPGGTSATCCSSNATATRAVAAASGSGFGGNQQHSSCHCTAAHLCADLQRQPHGIHQVGLHHPDVLRQRGVRWGGRVLRRCLQLHLAAGQQHTHCYNVAPSLPGNCGCCAVLPRPAAQQGGTHVQVGAVDAAAAGRLGGPVLLLELALLLLQPEAGINSACSSVGGRRSRLRSHSKQQAQQTAAGAARRPAAAASMVP